MGNNRKTLALLPEHLVTLTCDAQVRKTRDGIQLQFPETRQAVKFVGHARTAGFVCRYDLVTLPRVVLVYDKKDR